MAVLLGSICRSKRLLNVLQGRGRPRSLGSLVLALTLWPAIAGAQTLLPEEQSAARVRCGAFLADPSAERGCMAQEEAATLALPQPQLSRLSASELSRLRIACAPAKPDGAAAWRRCAATRVATILAERPPDPVKAASDLVREAQIRLARLGYDPGKADGLLGARTRKALDAFTAARGLPAGSAIDERLLSELDASLLSTQAPDDSRTATLPEAAELPTPRDDQASSSTPAFELPQANQASPGPSPSPAEVAGPLSPTELFARVGRAVYAIVGFKSEAGIRAGRGDVFGSAVAIGPRTLVTNCHVVADLGWVAIVEGDTVLGVADIVREDRDLDRCTIQTKDEVELRAVEAFRPFADLRVGERVYSIGNPQFPSANGRILDRTLGEGLISGLRQDGPVKLIQTTALVMPGSSGGGLFDDRGRLIGVTTVHSQGTQVNFAVAADGLAEVATGEDGDLVP